MRVRVALEGVGSALLLLPWYIPFLDPTNIPISHHGFPVTNLICGFLVDLLGIAVLMFGFLVAIEHLPVAGQRTLEALYVVIMLWRTVDIAFKLWIVSLALTNSRYQLWWYSLRTEFLILALMALGIFEFFLPSVTKSVVSAVRLLIAAFAFSALWIVPQLIHLALIHPPKETPPSQHSSSSYSGEPRRRIVWILFDELSYDQTFDHRASGVELPNFSRLRTESVSLGNLSPAGFYTDRIVPSLLLGHRIDRIRSTLDLKLSYFDESMNRWKQYDPEDTLFELAQKNGWSTGIDGWYIPYCQILGGLFDYCSWEPERVTILPMEAGGASEDETVLANAAVVWEMLLGKLGKERVQPASAHTLDYGRVMERAQTLIADDQITFAFVHLPVPHPPGIYDRHLHVLRGNGTYLDNLVLADDALGMLLHTVEATPLASRTTLIISSDHSWRVPLWKYSEGWTAEEQRACGGKFDERPVLLVHFPGQTSGLNVDSSVPEMLEHDMIAGMLQRKINSPDDLSAFLSQRSR
jgi:hypothetical protein